MRNDKKAFKSVQSHINITVVVGLVISVPGLDGTQN